MKGVFIFDHKNDIVFIKNDEQFNRHVHSVATVDGLTQETNCENNEVDPNIILQLYSPLIASQRFMIGQAKNPYNRITTANGFTIVLKQFSDYVFVAINGDGEESADFMHRKLLVLRQIITFLHGPCIEEVRPSKHKERSVRWKLIGRFLQTWCDLYNTEQSFLVEAVERLHVNQMLNSRSVELLEKAVSQIKAAGEKHATHAMLIVNSKLLSLYSVRNATVLGSGDQMMLILLANMLFGGEPVQSNAAEFSSLSSREAKSRPSNVTGPVKIGSSAALNQMVPSERPLQDDDSSSDLEVNQSSSDQKGSESEDGQKESLNKRTIDSPSGSTSDQGYVKVGSSSKGRRRSTNFPDISDTMSQSSLKLAKNAKSESGRFSRSQSMGNSLMYTPRAFEGSMKSTEQSEQYKHLPGQSNQSSVSIGQSEQRNSLGSSQHIHSSGSNFSSVPKVILTSSKPRPAEVSDISTNSQTSRVVNDVIYEYSQDTTYTQPENDGELSITNNSRQEISSKKSPKSNDFVQIVLPRQLSVPEIFDESTRAIHSLPVTPIPFVGNPATLDNINEEQTHPKSVTETRPISAHSELSGRTPDESTEYPNLTVMLMKGEVENVPHMVHCVHVMNGIYLIIVCERTKVQYAQVLSQTASTIRTVLSPKPISIKHTPKQIQEFIDGSVKKLGELLKKSKGATHIERVIVDISNKWEAVKRQEFLKHYQPSANEYVPLPPKLEIALSSMLEKLHDLFRLLYLGKTYVSQERYRTLLDCINEVHIAVYKGLLDYKDYINIKSQRNIAMTTYMNEFPGMVHFLFMNRTTNHVVAASFNENALEEEKESSMQRLVQKQVWQMYERMRQKLAAGFMNVTAREGPFHFSYFLWFEDNQGGFTLTPLKPYTGLRPTENLLPGLLSFNFYQWLQRTMFPRVEKKTVQCYEMFVVHVGLVPTDFAVAHCRKLAAKLWESSGESRTSASLL